MTFKDFKKCARTIQCKRKENTFFQVFVTTSGSLVHSPTTIKKEIEHTHIDIKPTISTMDFS
jgi:hypothetical protein